MRATDQMNVTSAGRYASSILKRDPPVRTGGFMPSLAFAS